MRPLGANCPNSRADPFSCSRTDAISIEGIEAAIERSLSYVEAGADAILPQLAPGFDLSEKKRFNEAMSVPTVAFLSETEAWVRKYPLPSIDQIEEAGYKICILPLVALCSAAMAIKKALEVMKIEGTSEGLLTDMMDFDTITSTLGLGDIIRVEKNYGRY